MFVTDILSKLTDRSNERHLASRKPDYEQMVPVFDEQKTVSCNIFQICLRGRKETSAMILEELPDIFLKNMESLKQRNPGWKYRLLADMEAEDFILSTYGSAVLSYYMRIAEKHGSARADFLRVLLLYARGGVYLDLKSTLSKSISSFLHESDRFLVMWWDDGRRHYLIPDYIEKGEIPNGFIVAAAGHPFLRKIIIEIMSRIDRYNPYRDGVGWSGVQQVTGPAMFTKTIYHCIQESSGEFREEKPMQNCGYIVSFLEQDYVPGAYQKQTSMRDYRKLRCPVTRAGNPLLYAVNSVYIRIISKRQQ